MALAASTVRRRSAAVERRKRSSSAGVKTRKPQGASMFERTSSRRASTSCAASGIGMEAGMSHPPRLAFAPNHPRNVPTLVRGRADLQGRTRRRISVTTPPSEDQGIAGDRPLRPSSSQITVAHPARHRDRRSEPQAGETRPHPPVLQSSGADRQPPGGASDRQDSGEHVILNRRAYRSRDAWRRPHRCKTPASVVTRCRARPKIACRIRRAAS